MAGNNIVHVQSPDDFGVALCGAPLGRLPPPRAALVQMKISGFFGEGRRRDWACCVDCAHAARAKGLV